MPKVPLVRTRGQVANILLEHAIESTNLRPLSQRNMADMTGSDWETVHASLKSLQDEGVIRIERQRLIVNKHLLKKIARTKRQVPSRVK